MNMSDTQPSLKRSLLYRTTTGEHYKQQDGGMLVAQFSANDAEQAKRCGLLDLSVARRTGLRGKNAPSVLSEHLPGMANTSVIQANFAEQLSTGEWVLRLGKTEYWVLSSLTGTNASLDALDQAASQTADCYPLYCQSSHAWFVLTGDYISEVMAKLCAVDLNERVFPVGKIAQTSVARVNAIVVKQTYQGIPAFSILSDSSSAEYLWLAILDAMQEFNGQAIGADVLTV